jgi:hypothetical protein
MSGYPSLDELATVLRGGAGIAIVCEGQDYRDDQFIYESWFNHLGRRVTFHAQDGWKRVVSAVDELRRRGTPVPVFGVMDRDFAADDEIARQSDPAFDGFCYRLPRYDLEGYLLEPDGWFEVVQKDLFWRERTLPEGWDSVEAVVQQIHSYYREALPLSAHNWTVKRLRSEHEGKPSFTERKYLKAIEATRANPEEALASWASLFGAEDEARACYQERLRFLEECADSIEALRAHVSGKVVFRALCQRIPHAPRCTRRDDVSLANSYLKVRMEPPADVAALIHRILARGEAERSR